IAYRGWIDNVQASWVKCGVVGARQILQAGANDLGGTLMDENISRAAGASHGQELDESELRQIVEPLGRPLAQRTTLYGRTQTVASDCDGPTTTRTVMAGRLRWCSSERAGERDTVDRRRRTRTSARRRVDP